MADPFSIRTARFFMAATLGAALVAGCGYAGQDRRGSRDRVPPAQITGPAVSCIPLFAFRETQVRDARTIDFLRGRQGWRNVLPMNCPRLATERAFTYATSQSQLCSTDIIRVLENFGGRPQAGEACGLGKFTPIELR